MARIRYKTKSDAMYADADAEVKRRTEKLSGDLAEK